MRGEIKKFKYFELVRELALTGFKLKYHGSFFGYLWSLMKPLFLFIILYTVFNYVFKLGKAIPNYPIYLLIGVTLWGFFTETTSMCMTSIVGSGDLIRKVYFPRIVLPMATSLTSLITLSLNLVVVFIFLAVLRVPITVNVLWLPLFLIEYFIFVLGVSFFLAAVFVKFRDVGPIWEVTCQGLFYATPILYAANSVPDKYLRIMMLSPIAQIIQNIRGILLPSGVITSESVLGNFSFIPFLILIVVFITGYVVFQRMTAKFAEEV